MYGLIRRPAPLIPRLRPTATLPRPLPVSLSLLLSLCSSLIWPLPRQRAVNRGRSNVVNSLGRAANTSERCGRDDDDDDEGRLGSSRFCDLDEKSSEIIQPMAGDNYTTATFGILPQSPRVLITGVAVMQLRKSGAAAAPLLIHRQTSISRRELVCLFLISLVAPPTE